MANESFTAGATGGSTPAIAIGHVGDVVTSSLLWRYGGQLHLTVAVRARYRLTSEGVAARDAARGVPGLAAADDPVPYRRGCDVWMVGHCNAPPLNETAALTTRLKLFGAREQLIERKHRLMPGSDVGIAGYGPRRSANWLADHTQDGVVEIPPNFDWTQLHAAPVSQRVRFLEGNETLELEGVLAQRGTFRCRLPTGVGAARVWQRGSRPTDPGYPVHLVADTLGIDCDGPALTVVWRGSFPIEHREVTQSLLIAAGIADDHPLDWHEGWVMANTAALVGHVHPDGATVELQPGAPLTTHTLPFGVDSERSPDGLRPAMLEGAPWSERVHQEAGSTVVPPRRERAMTLDMNDITDLGQVGKPALPFRAAESAEDAVLERSSETTPTFDIAAMETLDMHRSEPTNGSDMADPATSVDDSSLDASGDDNSFEASSVDDSATWPGDSNDSS